MCRAGRHHRGDGKRVEELERLVEDLQRARGQRLQLLAAALGQPARRAPPVLAVVAVVARQRLPTVDRIVGGIDVEDECRGRRRAGADKQIDQVVVDEPSAAGFGRALDSEQDGRSSRGQLRLAAGVGVLEACQGRAGGQGPLGVGGDVGQDLEEGVVAQVVGVVGVGVAGEELVDLLGEQGLHGVVDELGGARVGQACGEIGEDAEGPFEGADGQQSGVGDEASALKIDVELLRAEIPA